MTTITIGQFRSLLMAMALLLAFSSVLAQKGDIPEGYKLLYQQDFSKASALEEFEMSDPTAWRVNKGDEASLELHGKSKYKPRVRSPFNIALIKDHLFGDFVLELELAQTGREYNHRDLCLFFNVENNSNFYYVHMASITDDHANNIFLVNDEARVKISDKTTEGTKWGATNSWHTARIERVVETGSIKIYFDNMEEPIMEATDKHFDVGRIGVGSFDDTGKFANIKVWGPALHQKPKGFFK